MPAIGTGGMRVLDIASKTSMFDYTGGSNFEAFSPDATRILANQGGDLALVDAATGTQIGSAPVITNGNLPDWSADGSKVAFARTGGMACPIPGFCNTIPGVMGADLFTVSVSGDNFGTPQMIVTGGGNNFYPSFSPDGALIAFNRSAGNASSFDAPDARLWAVAATGGTPVALTNASATANNVGDSWPKFAPYSHTFKGETIFWLTFSSRRDYGLRLLNSQKPVTMDDDERIAQIWMVGVPASAVMSGSMPTGGYPAFWLPFQSMMSGNHIAQWTETIARMPCTQVDGTPCPQGQECVDGECVGVPVL
jgi:TolB protein